jgi:uncharacterized BrkB/YihY/UPF0761 family membrane protein
MSRRIVTTNLQAAGGGPPDTYVDKVVKNIPADVIAAWLAATGAIDQARDVPATALLWAVFVVLLVITPFWILRQTSVPQRPPAVTQALIATGSFAVWVFAIGGPFARIDAYRPLYGSLALIGYTLVVALVNPEES